MDAESNVTLGSPPIAVGGLGGSGTRVVAAILQKAGVDIGRDLNVSLDNLWFTLLFKHPGILTMEDPDFQRLTRIFVTAMSGRGVLLPSDLAIPDQMAAVGRPQHDHDWLAARAQSLQAALATPVRHAAWGWKEPNTHMVIDRLSRVLPTLRYVHVIRNGLDMAFSSNRNQPQLWGPLVMRGQQIDGPRGQLKFWCWAHKRIIALQEALEVPVLLLRFEDLCKRPRPEIERLLAFCGITAGPEFIERASCHIAMPQSVGRHRTHSLHSFDAKDVDFVRSLGFPVGG